MHYLGLLKFVVRICDASHHNTHKTFYILLYYTMIVISENSWSFDYFLQFFGLGSFEAKDSLTAFIGFPFVRMFTCTFMECIS